MQSALGQSLASETAGGTIFMGIAILAIVTASCLFADKYFSVFRAALLDGVPFDPLAFEQDDVAEPEVDASESFLGSTSSGEQGRYCHCQA